MRGEICVGAASILSLVSMILMIFAHVGQINTSNVPRKISMASVNMTGYGAALDQSFIDPIDDIYTNNASAPLGTRAGLRQIYKFGLYSHCGYVNNTHGICGNHTIGDQFRPYDAITSDMAANYSIITQALIGDTTTFQDSNYLGQATKAAYWMLLLGTICAALALLTGILKNSLTFFVSTIFSVAGSILLLIGASIWTVMVKKCESVSDILIDVPSSPPIGITVSVGSGLYLTWAAFVCLVVSVVPYMISCCTYRG
ncbi:hypothetical protein Hypma_015162 [Hypsizygus marmoreus]|uniref:SUR7 family protein pun1 n=1 Tax=Hypsizygus marmoreus TaxID=39966 RepID=A0A369KCW1_HYPMA|nr:hypothetical protein Hypma_015162 [Hypsizygus marmoreus]